VWTRARVHQSLATRRDAMRDPGTSTRVLL
jgi:hypothetical protein